MLDEGLRLDLLTQKLSIFFLGYTVYTVPLNWLAKTELRGWGWLSILLLISNYCCKSKMLEENEAEETISFFCHIFVIDEILIGRVRLCAEQFCFRNKKAFSNL